MVYGLWTVVLSLLVLFPLAGHAATDAKETGTQDEASVVLKRSIEAGQEVSSRALSSKTRAAQAVKEAVAPVAKTEAAKAELTDFQKKIAAIVQGAVSGKGNTSSSSGTKVVAPKTEAAAKTAVKGAETVVAKAGQPAQTKPASKGPAPEKKLSSTEGQGGESTEEKELMITKTVSGTISSKSSSGIGLVFGVDKKTNSEMEMWLPLSQGFGVQGYKTADEIAAGDSVSVTYEETQEGGFKRSVKSVSLIKKLSNEENPYYEGETTP